MNSRKRFKAAIDALKGMSKCSIISLSSILIFLLILIVTLLTFFAFGNSCETLANCDPFKPVCGASERGEHQFFYSQCDMERENCMTGKHYKIDSYSHCNVHM